jgi:Protein-L-isoaspartate(D-aspartate) O-methyltransferase (PCMT)
MPPMRRSPTGGVQAGASRPTARGPGSPDQARPFFGITRSQAERRAPRARGDHRLARRAGNARRRRPGGRRARPPRRAREHRSDRGRPDRRRAACGAPGATRTRRAQLSAVLRAAGSGRGAPVSGGWHGVELWHVFGAGGGRSRVPSRGRRDRRGNARVARENRRRAGYTDVVLAHGDGGSGIPSTPRTIGSASRRPAPTFRQQLAASGRLIAPVLEGRRQRLTLLEKTLDGPRRTIVEDVLYGSLQGRFGSGQRCARLIRARESGPSGLLTPAARERDGRLSASTPAR